jgi:hypothetical protein
LTAVVEGRLSTDDNGAIQKLRVDNQVDGHRVAPRDAAEMRSASKQYRPNPNLPLRCLPNYDEKGLPVSG